MKLSTVTTWRQWAVLVAVSTMLSGSAQAGSHSWRFSELYSSPDKTIQFIEMQEINDSENEFSIQFHWFATDSYNQTHSLLLDTPLPANTANKKFLVGSQSYAQLPGVPAPDYLIADGAIEPAGDTVVWWFYQTMIIPPDTMPSTGVNSLTVIEPAAPENGFSVGLNSPTNFAGETGTVVLPNPLPARGAPGWVYLLVIGIAALGTRSLSRRRVERFAH